MSSQGPGWWQASDGRWYPPEQHPDHVPAPPAPDAPSAPEAPTSATPPGAWAPPEPEQARTSPAPPGWAPTAPPIGAPMPGPGSPGSVPPGAAPPGSPPAWGTAPPPGPGAPAPAPSSKKPLIIVLVLVAVLAVVGIVGVAAVLFLGTAERDDTGTIIDQGDLGVFDLQVGDCFTDDAAAPMTPDETIAVKSVEAIPCDDEHGAEVFANVDLPDGEFPGDVQMSDRATTLCFDEFEPYVGAPYESSEYDYGWFAPTEETWSRGDRTINCVLFRTDGGLSSGSARGSGR